jgi:hypothetical protein
MINTFCIWSDPEEIEIQDVSLALVRTLLDYVCTPTTPPHKQPQANTGAVPLILIIDGSQSTPVAPIHT